MKTQLLTIGALALSLLTASAQEIATWAGFTKAAVTWTFDDGANESSAHTWAAGELDKYGFPGTFYLVTNWTSGRYSTYSGMVAKGHEIGSHTDSHTSSDGELASSQSTIDRNISGQKCITIAYPNCQVPTESTVLRYYIGGRICGNQNNSKSPYNFARLDSHICGTQGKNSASQFQSTCQSAAGSNGWTVFLIHGFSQRQAAGSYSPTSESAFTETLSWLDKNRSTYWVATFRDAIKYIKERDNATLKETSASASEIAYSLTDNLDNSIYDYPLSIRIPMPDGWNEGVIVYQNEEEIESKVEGNYVYFDAVPDGGTILVKSLGSVVPDPEFKFTEPTTAQNWCLDSTYTISWTMSGEASAEYSLIWGEDSDETLTIKNATASSEWGETADSPYWTVDKILSDDGAHGENSRWGSMSGSDEYVILDLGTEQSVGGVVIDEFTTYGIVTSFEIQYDKNGSWETAYKGTSIGNDFSTTFAPFKSSKVRFYIHECGDGANINYIALKGTSSVKLKEGITGNGSYTWKPEVAGSGSLSIKKASGRSLGASAIVTVEDCNAANETGTPSTPDTPSAPSTPSLDNACYEGGGYTGPSCDGEGSGAYYTGVYPTPFQTYLGKTDAEVQKKLDQLWNHYFEGNDNSKVYYDRGNGEAYIYDTGNRDVRSEGMSYGMMICVQTNHRDEFDKLWAFARNHMWHNPKSGGDGYFSWQVGTNGDAADSNCAPDGEMYFVMSLLFASNRWGNDGQFDYMADAQSVLKSMIKGNSSSLFNEQEKVITFQPTYSNYLFSDPSYDLPAFVDLFARWSDTNKEFWSEAATATRAHLKKSSHSSSGLFTDYNNFDGTPKYTDFNSNSHKYMYDAMRCAMNVGMDYYLFGADAKNQEDMMLRLINHFEKDGYQHARFNWDGSGADENYTLGETGANAVGCFALMNDPANESKVKTNLKKAWDASLMTGQYRYYDGLVHYLSMLHLCGSFKIWKPEIEVNDVVMEGKGSVEYNGKTYTESTTFCEFVDCEYNNVSIIIDEESTGIFDATDNNASDFCYFDKETGVISVKSADVVENVTLCDLNGRLLLSEDGSEVEASGLSDGIYIVRVQTVSGKVQYSKVSVSK